MRTITLELLRHGPAHNQLLSPLTDYLALCENHGAVSLRVPFEHNQLTHRLRALSYNFGAEPRDFQLPDTARVIGDMLGNIPGLTADLNRQCPNSAGSDTTHLRLIISASELALLPFELALAPPGFPGAGQYLTLQPQTPVCITRETGRVANQYLVWPKRPKILFAFASPAGYENVPAQAHLLALRQAIAPWLALPGDNAADENGDDEATRQAVENERIKLIAERLWVLPNASVEALEKACANGQYTHIHILAHGARLPDANGDGTHYGLALHQPGNASGVDLVSGARLATTLQAQYENHDKQASRVAVVTLASCNSSNVGSVHDARASISASISHDLHEAGIPLVIASQFPLSFAGSVMMVEKLYNGLLWGNDPRELLVDLRRSLHSRFENRHDWASLTAYTSLPPDFDAQLENIRVEMAKQSINAAMRRADLDLHDFPGISDRQQISTLNASPEQSAALKKGKVKLQAALDRIGDGKRRLLGIMHANPAQRERILSKLAGVSKREAQLQFHVGEDWQFKTVEQRAAIINGMYEARKFYWETRFLEPNEAYKTVQYLALSVTLLHMNQQLPLDLQPERDILQLWLAAELQALNAAASESNNTRAWAYCDLAELYLMAPMIPKLGLIRPDTNFNAMAQDAASKVTILAGRSSYHNFSTRRQINRYLIWFSKMVTVPVTPVIPDKVLSTALAMLKKMPEGEEPEWND